MGFEDDLFMILIFLPSLSLPPSLCLSVCLSVCLSLSEEDAELRERGGGGMALRIQGEHAVEIPTYSRLILASALLSLQHALTLSLTHTHTHTHSHTLSHTHTTLMQRLRAGRDCTDQSPVSSKLS